MSDGIEANFQLQLSSFQLQTELQLPSTGVTAIFGPSGCGKTTLLRCIAGLEPRVQGKCLVKGHVWQDSSQQIFLPTHKRPLGYVFQEASLFPHLTVQQNLDFGRKRTQQTCAPEQMQQAIDLLGIRALLKRMPDKLSGGERQRVAIARALAVCPQVLLMDEPLAALDLTRKQEIMPFLTRLHRELAIPILYVTHSPEEVTQLADYLVVLNSGKVLIAGNLEDTLTRLDSPLVQGREASTVLRVHALRHEAEFHLTHVTCSGGQFSVPYQAALAIGETLRLRILARDVSITLKQPEQTSILNVLQGTITAMAHDNAGQTLVRLNVGNQHLLAHITYKSMVQLGLQVGMQVFVQIKGMAVLA